VPIRVIIADDHPVVRLGVRALLEGAGRYHVVAEAACADELLGALERAPCDVLMTDFSMPGGSAPDGQAMLAMIHRRYPALPVVLMTMFTNVPTLRMAMKNGVRGVIDKACSLLDLPRAIDEVLAGAAYVSSSLRSELCGGGDEETGSLCACLSPKELEVLRLYASGLSITQIAARLDRSISTISRQRISAMNKLGIRAESELYAFASEHGLAMAPCPTPPAALQSAA
jgi:two-component system capsular synthesis response regulator RcsB